MFFEGRLRISTYLNGVDLGERSANSVVRQVILQMALQLIERLLGSDLTGSANIDPLPQMLLWCVALVGDAERVHIRTQSTEIFDRFAVRLLEFASHFVVGRVEEFARLVE